MNYFRYFPTVSYMFTDDAGRSFAFEVTNQTAHVKIASRIKDHIAVFYDYIIQEGERPDSVSVKLYGSVNYTWVILLVNNILTLFDWPLTQREFVDYITERYGSVSAAQALSLYKTSDGFLVDLATYNLLDGSKRGVPISAYDDELQKNEDKRRIKVIPADFVGPLTNDLKKVMSV